MVKNIKGFDSPFLGTCAEIVIDYCLHKDNISEGSDRVIDYTTITVVTIQIHDQNGKELQISAVYYSCLET
jgi:hypothetical protein